MATNHDNAPPILGVIGGSGIYDVEGLSDVRWEAVDTPYGNPSDELMFGTLDGLPVVFLPRHGRGHRVPPSDLNFRANMYALKYAGVTEVVSLSAVGSLREDLVPGTFVVVDQFIDRTFARVKSFFESGLVAHVSMANPVCCRLGNHIEAAARDLDINVVRGGIYLVMEGPQFSSRAESELYRSWGCSVIGMTNMPEAKLAREAELCYATVAMVTDFDCWHEDHDDVTVDQIIGTLISNAGKGRSLVRALARQLELREAPCEQGCHTSLDNAIITAPEARDPEVVERLATIVGRTLG
ncbi:MAG: S-methyl-5'-thioadenosine phosphorylase [Alphaproteobacteria bacterium]|nr:S-methyl-5'-thioadenosine phosphorylase [Alphaproteobacteria bacterium]HCP01805.1 S-methyl-5'-thioadenosine phosphorylase [Rhodospirillaceae bacterium]